MGLVPDSWRVVLLSLPFAVGLWGGCTRANPDFVGGATDTAPRLDARPRGDGRFDVGRPPDLGRTDKGGPGKPKGVDVLVVVDNSAGMGYPQQWLAQDIDTLIDGLNSLPGGANYRIGVTTTDMGIGAFANAGCTASGDNGELTVPPQCPKPQSGVRYVERVGTAVNVPTSVDQAVSCMIREQTTEGCGFEQPLKAMKAALSGSNPGFLRSDAALAVVILTNEDDCSAASNQLYSLQDTSLGPYTSYRCFQHGMLCNGVKPPLQATVLTGCAPGQNWLHVVATEYGESLKKLRPAGWVSVLVLAGPPQKTVTVEQVYSAYGVAESCAAGGVEGYPAFRLEQFVAYFGSYGGFTSICDASYRPALQSLLLRIQSAF